MHGWVHIRDEQVMCIGLKGLHCYIYIYIGIGTPLNNFLSKKFFIKLIIRLKVDIL